MKMKQLKQEIKSIQETRDEIYRDIGEIKAIIRNLKIQGENAGILSPTSSNSEGF